MIAYHHHYHCHVAIGASLQSLSLPSYVRFQKISDTCPNLTHLGISRWYQDIHDIARAPLRLPHLTSLTIETLPVLAATTPVATTLHTMLHAVPQLLDTLRVSAIANDDDGHIGG